MMRFLGYTAALALCTVLRAQVQTPGFRFELSGTAPAAHELFSVRSAHGALPALAASTPVRLVTDHRVTLCTIDGWSHAGPDTEVHGACGELGTFEQRFSATSEVDVLAVATRIQLNPGVVLRSAEDRYNFLPRRHTQVNELQGPLDFVWSQNLKRGVTDLIPQHAFKSPAVMLQQGPVFAALLPDPSSRHVEPLALDLDVTSDNQPWMAYGAIPSTPHDHSYFRRSADASLHPLDTTVEYRYALVLSAQPSRLGYRRVTHLLWTRLGHSALQRGAGTQQNVLRPDLASFASWRSDAWQTYADRIYREFPCGQRMCATLTSNRNYMGDWQHPEPDAWFNAWFQTLRTAYGWYLHGRTVGDPAIMRKAENILNLALSAPQNHGAFPTVFLVNSARWVPGDGWASFPDSYHAFSMSWTAYWMLRWAEDLTPARRSEVLAFVTRYAEFLIAHQQASGVIASWYNAATLEPRTEFRDFNAETAPSALLLAELGSVSGNRRYTEAAERGMAFVQAQVVPRQRWFDFETFLSCARKDFDFFDGWTAQYPQNNLGEIQAPEAMLVLYRSTGSSSYLQAGEQMLDYLLLTQQVWSNPEFTPNLFGGFTTQNTDAEWSDARQGYAAMVLFDYYNATGSSEYLERAVAAARSTFAVAPWENWAHTGHIDQPGALTGFHWGTGSAMTSVEMMTPELGDAFIDVEHKVGLGFDQATIPEIEVSDTAISFTLTSPDGQRTFLVRFRGIDPYKHYSIRCNHQAPVQLSGAELLAHGLTVAHAIETPGL